MKNKRKFFRLIIGLILLAVGCSTTPAESNTATPTQPDVTAPTADNPTLPPATPTPTPSPMPPTATGETSIFALHNWTDESAIMSGLCYASVADAADQSFVFRREVELRNLYDLADNSRLCSHPVGRGSFDFSSNRVLVGVWSSAVGCAADHSVISVRRDEVAMIYAVRLRLVVESGCDYELVRPFWIGLDGLAAYDVRLIVEN